jgi:hypothetical protein
MSLETVRGVLLWCAIINYGILLLWAVLFLLARDRFYAMQRPFRLSPEQLDLVNYAGIVIYKLGILMFNLVPYIALRIVG